MKIDGLLETNQYITFTINTIDRVASSDRNKIGYSRLCCLTAMHLYSLYITAVHRISPFPTGYSPTSFLFIMFVMNVLRAEPVRAGGSGESSSPAGRLTTKSVACWPEPQLVQVQGKMEASPSRIRRLKNKTRDETGGETGTEAHGGARRSQGGKVILILRIRLHRSCTYIGYVINNNQYAMRSTIRRTTSRKRGASTCRYETEEIQAKQKEL